jgi:hypothetical protein
MWEELENALAWYAAAPSRWMASAKQDLSAAAEWIWVVILGDFADEQSTAQTVTGTVISMIPFVDQICDVRDIVANCKKINEDTSDKWAWVGLVLTLIGLFPTLGSLAKGCFKILFAYGRKAMFKAGKQALDSGMWNATKPFVEVGIGKLNDFLARPEVRKTLKALKWDNPYKELAKIARELAGKLNTAALTKAFDEGINALKKLTDLVQKWGTAAMKTQAGHLLSMIKGLRDQANKKFAEVLAPVQDWINKLARRLDVEADNSYRAYTNSLNPHRSTRMSLDAELEQLKAAPPEWVKVAAKGRFPGAKKVPPIPIGHPDIGDAAKPPLKSAFETFSGHIDPATLPPGTVLVRVVDPGSFDNSFCWMTKAEFDKLKSKAEWRDKFAVWRNWNGNGEYVTYTVPPGPGLPVWRGATASQQMKDRAGNAVKANDEGDGFWLQGGAEQIVLDPKALDPAHASKRTPTGWGYSEGDIDVSLVGIPTLTNNWR